MTLQEILSQITFRNIIDVLLVAFLLYQIIAMMRGTRAAQVVIGLLVIFIAYALSSLLEFETLYWIISKFYASFIIVVIVLFQDDIRRLLTRFGRGPFVSGLEEGSGLAVIEEVVSAAKSLSHERLGAILVFERGIGLERLYDHAVRMDALVSEQLLHAIFQSFSPLHDGAVIIQKNRISCASAHLPLSKSPGTGKKLGTRHSAAVGISEQTDAVVLVVSEETGGISIAVNGELQRQQSPELAKRRLIQLLLPAGSRRTHVGWFAQNRFFYRLNMFSLRMRSAFFRRRPFRGNERRQRTTTDRRLQHAYAWGGDHDTIRAVERENRLASNEVRMNLRFPGAVAQSQNFRSFGGSVVLAPKNRNETPRHSEEENHDTSLPEMESDLNDDGNSNLPPAPTALEQNEAAQALIDLGPEDRMVPPELPTPPPRDVSIGGVSLNPPLESEGKTDSESLHNSPADGAPRRPSEGEKP